MSACFPRFLGALTLAAAVWTAALAPADDADDRYAVGAAHYDQARWKLAIEEFQTLLQSYPNHPKAAQADFFLAEALLQLKRFDEAAARYRSYLARDPQGRFAREALFRSGEADYLAGRGPQARKALAEFAAKNPGHALAAYALPYLGDVTLAQGDAAAAAGYYRQALERFPDGRLQDVCRFGLARALEKQGQPEEAERLYLALSAKTTSPQAGDALFQLGALQFAAGRWAEVVASLESYETRYPQAARRGEAHLARAWSLFKLNRPAEAKEMLAALRSDPAVAPDACYWLGMIQRAEQKWADAATTLSAAAGVSPNHRLAAAMRFYAGDAYLQAGDAAAAIRLFDQVLATPEHSLADDAARGKVQAAVRLKDHAAVDRDADQFKKRFPKSPLARDVDRMRARSLLDRRQSQRAIDLLEPLTAGRVEQNNLEDRFLLALAYQTAKRYQDAMAVLLPVLDNAPPALKAPAELAHGSLLLALQRYPEAIKPLEAASTGNMAGEDLIRAKAELAIALVRTGKIDRAKKLYADLGTEPPQGELMAAALEHLAEAAYQAGDSAWAGELFARLAQGGSAPQQWKGISGVAWSHYKAGRMQQAADEFAKLLARNPEPAMAAEASLARGRALEKLGRPAEALNAYDLIIDRYAKTDSYAAALRAAAGLRSRQGDFLRAAALLQIVAGLKPPPADLDEVLYQSAWALADAGKPAESTKILNRIRQEHPQSRFWTDCVFRLAERAWEAKDGKQAAALVAELLARKPEPRLREHGLYLSGQIAAAEGRWADVRKPMEQLVTDYPQSTLRNAAGYWAAEALYQQQDYDAALARLAPLAGLAAGRRESWMGMIALRRAQVLGHQKKWAEAEAIAAKIAADFPGFPQQYEVDYLLGLCRADQADFDGARKAYQRAIRSPAGAKTDTAAMAQWMIGESYFHQKNYETALREYLRVEILYAYPRWQSLALLQAGKCHEMLGEWREAAKLYERLLANYPKTEAAAEASTRLKTAQQRIAAAGSRK